MNADREPDEELLASISDGAPADWSAAELETDGARRARLASLHDLSRIAEFSRGLQREPAPTATPERWGDLLLLERLGSGARADVFRAWDPELQREIALKLMRTDLAEDALIEEGRAVARIRHANVVAVHGIDRRDGRVGLRMELVRGGTLEAMVRAQGPLDAASARRLGLEIGAALGAVHGAGLLHRDIKPANVVRDAEGRFVLTDFGLGMRWGGSDAGRGPSGTPMYMAPELLAGSPPSERSDLYALGLLLWFALAGRHPFETGSLPELVKAARRGPLPALGERSPELPASLTRIVARAIAPNPEDRFPSAKSLVEALEAWSPARAVAARRPSYAVAAVVLAVLGAVALGTWSIRREQGPATDPALPGVPVPASYAVEASFLRREAAGSTRLAGGDRVKPGDRLSLEVRVTQPAWVYVLNEDERGERYLLFPQPRFDARNPLPAESTFVLPGTVEGKENAWSVTSAGGREYFLVVASPEPVPEIEAELERIPALVRGAPIDYARVGPVTVQRLRGVGGVEDAPADPARPVERSPAFERFRALAGRETGVRGVWVRQFVLENPVR